MAIQRLISYIVLEIYLNEVNYIQSQTDGYTTFNHRVTLNGITMVNYSFFTSHWLLYFFSKFKKKLASTGGLTRHTRVKNDYGKEDSVTSELCAFILFL